MLWLDRHFLTSFVIMLLVSSVEGVHAQSTGLLLGLRYETAIERPLPYYAGDADSLKQASYYTLFVTRSGSTVQVAHRSDDLIIPRGSSFIRAGSKRSVYNDWVEDFIWASPPAVRAEVPGIQTLNGENCEGHREQIILFASARYLSLQQRTAGYCYGAPHPWYFNHLAFVPTDSTGHTGIEVDEVLGLRAWRTFEDQARLLIEEAGQTDARSHPPDPANWGIVRQSGRWVAIGRVELSDQISVGDHRDLVLSTEVPAELVGENRRRLPLEVVRRVAPDMTDYFVSPSGDLVVIMRDSTLTVHPVDNQFIGRRLLEVSLRDDAVPVLAQWATGDRVSRWLKLFESPRFTTRSNIP